MIDLAQLGKEIAAAHAAVEASESGAALLARHCGELLNRAKRHFRHGHWLPFIAQCGLSKRTAAVYMMVARRWPEIIENSSGAANFLTIRQAQRLLKKVRIRREPPVPHVIWKDVSPEEHRELRRIAVEMDTFRYVSRTFNERPEDSGFDIVAGCGGAPVYWDVVGGDPQVGRPIHRFSRAEVLADIEAFIDGGPRSLVSDLTVDVARRRIAGDRTLSPPWLPPDTSTMATLSLVTQQQLTALAEIFDARTVDETVAMAVSFAHARLVVDDDDVPTWVTEADFSDPIGEHDHEIDLPKQNPHGTV